MTREGAAPVARAAELLARGYTGQQLRDNYEQAAKYPGTAWHVTLLAEMRRRGLDPEGGAA